jgi:hypothetical protein
VAHGSEAWYTAVGDSTLISDRVEEKMTMMTGSKYRVRCKIVALPLVEIMEIDVLGGGGGGLQK